MKKQSLFLTMLLLCLFQALPLHASDRVHNSSITSHQANTKDGMKCGFFVVSPAVKQASKAMKEKLMHTIPEFEGDEFIAFTTVGQTQSVAAEKVIFSNFELDQSLNISQSEVSYSKQHSYFESLHYELEDGSK